MIRTVLENLPCRVKGFTVEDEDGDYTVFLNARLTWEENRETFKHELKHIQGDDHRRLVCADGVEFARHA